MMVSSCWRTTASFDCQQTFLVADDYRPNSQHNPPYSKSDDVAVNEIVEVQIYEHLLLPNRIIETGSKKDNSKIDETNIKNPTKRLGEVDYTGCRILSITTYSAKNNITININELNKSLNIKKALGIATVHFQEIDLTKGFTHSRGPLVIKKSNGTGVPLFRFTAFFRSLRHDF